MEHNTNETNGIATYFLSVFAAGFKIFGLLSATELMNLMLTGASFVSVFMLIVINWPKFIDRLKRKKDGTNTKA